MFDIGWSELVVIAVVALIAIGPKELPGVLRMVGQWIGKARKMAAEFQGQFQEAMREAEMADIKKSFDEVKEAATGHRQRQHHDLAAEGRQRVPADRRHRQARDRQACRMRRRPPPSSAPVTTPTTPAAPTPETFVEAEAHAAASEPLAIVSEIRPEPAPQDIASAAQPTCSRTPKRHERRRHRGQQGAVDGSPDRAALAADQGAARLRHRLHLLLLLRQADLQRAGLAVRLDRGAREFEIHLHRAAGIFHHAVEARAVRRRLHLVSDRGDADLQVRRARPLQA